jgi:hypothetical protein
MTYINSFDGLVQFQTDVIEPLVRNVSLDEVPFPPGYREPYEHWTEVVGDALIKMSPADRLSSFSDYLREENKRFVDKAIKRMLVTPAEKKKWRQSAIRGQVLRVSKDGVHFDKIMRSDQIDKSDGDTTFVLSDTCRSTTNDLQEVCDEQSGLMIAGKLRSQHFLVQSVTPGREFKAEVIHPKSGKYSVTVDLDKPITEILSFNFANGKGESKTVTMNEVGEAYGVLESSISSTKDVLSAAIGTKAKSALNSAKELSSMRAGAAAAMTAAALSKKRSTKHYQRGEMPETVLPNGTVVPNVQAAKTNVEARQENSKLGVENSKKQEMDSYEGYHKSLGAAQEFKDQKAVKRKSLQARDQKNRGTMMKAASVAGGAGGVFSTVAAWLIM